VVSFGWEISRERNFPDENERRSQEGLNAQAFGPPSGAAGSKASKRTRSEGSDSDLSGGLSAAPEPAVRRSKHLSPSHCLSRRRRAP
jgi:hypothetical protein